MAALIRVMNGVTRSALGHGHVQHRHDELAAEVRFHRPANDPLAPRVEHDGEIQNARPRANVGDVCDPQPIRAGHGELAIDEVRRRPRHLAAHRRAELATADALQPRLPHQAGDALTADVVALRGELGMDPRRAVRPALVAMRGLDLRGQLHIDRRVPVYK